MLNSNFMDMLMESAEPLSGDHSLLPGNPIPSANRLENGEPFWNPLGDQVPTGRLGRIDPHSPVIDKKHVVELPPEPEDGIFGPHDGSHVWDLLDGWARHHGADADLGLLVCASAAAHATGARGIFPLYQVYNPPAPTLIARKDDLGFHQVVQAAIAPLCQIQRDLEKTYAPMRRKRITLSNLNRADCFPGMVADDLPWIHTPCRELDPDGQPHDVVKFLMEGKMPKMMFRALKNYHQHTAVFAGEVDELPQTAQARENRLDAIGSMSNGYWHGRFAIRGFIRLSKEDLDWSLTKRNCFTCDTLPISSMEADAVDQSTNAPGAKEGFERLHRLTVRRALRLRFDRANPMVYFSDEAAAENHRIQGDSYMREMPAVSHLISLSGDLYHLIVWYLLHLTMATSVRIEPAEITCHALGAARRLRRRIAEIRDGHSAILIGREKQRRMLQLLHRMERLGRPSTPRDLARGFDKQKMSVINPMIDFLVEHHVFIRESGKLMCLPDSREAFDRIDLEQFTPAMRDVPSSLIARLDRFEQREREGKLSNQNTPTETPCQS